MTHQIALSLISSIILGLFFLALLYNLVVYTVTTRPKQYGIIWKNFYTIYTKYSYYAVAYKGRRLSAYTIHESSAREKMKHRVKNDLEKYMKKSGDQAFPKPYYFFSEINLFAMVYITFLLMGFFAFFSPYLYFYIFEILNN